MSFKTHSFTTPFELDLFLNGSVVGGKNVVTPNNKGKILGLHGLTLTINATLVTFADPTGAGLTLAEIKTAIDTLVGVGTVSWYKGRMLLQNASGVTVASTGTANSFFGFSTTTNTVGTVINPYDAAVPRVTAIGPSPRLDSYFVVVEEA